MKFTTAYSQPTEAATNRRLTITGHSTATTISWMKTVSMPSNILNPFYSFSDRPHFCEGFIPIQSIHLQRLRTVRKLTIVLAIPSTAKNITKPVLLLTASKDPIGTPARAELSTRPFAPDMRVKQIDAGHFMMLEKADEVNEALREFFDMGGVGALG